MNYRAIFCDIDGTLLDSNHALRKKTADKIRSLHNAGTPFILVSARNPEGVYFVQKQIGIQAPIVCYGGALVLDENRNPVHSIGFSMHRVIELKKRIASSWKNVTVTVYSYDHWFVDDCEHPHVTTEAGITGATAVEISMDALVEHPEDAHKMLCIGEPADIQAMESPLCRENPDLLMIKSSPIFLEIMNCQVSKANGLEYLCQAMRISPSEVVAFGDNYNDVDMLESAGLGIAMGNAPEAVREKAGRTTSSNDAEGVLEALESLQFAPMTHSVRFERASFQ